MKTVSVVAAIIADGNRVFATQRGYSEFKDGVEVIERNNKKCRIYTA